MSEKMDTKLMMEGKCAEQEIQGVLTEIAACSEKLSLMKHDAIGKVEVKKAYKNAFVEIQRVYENALQEENLDDVFKLNRKLKKYAKLSVEFADKQEDSYLYTIGTFVGAFHVLSGMAPKRNEEQIFNIRMARVIDKAHVKATIKYLYDHEFAKNGELCEKIEISASQLNRVMKDLVAIRCVERYAEGKYAFYSLTKNGRKYVKEVMGYKKKQSIEICFTCASRKPQLSSDNKIRGITYALESKNDDKLMSNKFSTLMRTEK